MKEQIRRRSSLLIGLLLLGVYAVRAGYGWTGGISYSLGSRLAAEGEYAAALPHLERAAVGEDRISALWLAAEVREGIWQSAFINETQTEETQHQLALALRDYTEVISASPAAGWYWSDLGSLYRDRELAARMTEQLPLGLLGHGPWALVGRPGRIAIGLSRIGLQREASVYRLHDQLALILFEYSLQDAALAAVAEAARVQPIYYLHPFKDLKPAPPGMLDAFAEASRAALGETPLVKLTVHLTALGRVELARENYVQAERDLRRALENPGHSLNRAEANYFLGVALMEQERYGEAWTVLDEAAAHENVREGSLVMQARIAERSGSLAEALEQFRKLRRLQPRNIGYALQFARIARQLERWNQAEEALKWARITHLGDLRPRRELVHLYLGMGDFREASKAIRDLERQGASTEEVAALNSLLTEARRR